MLTLVRTLLLASVGAIDLTEDKVRSLLDDLIRRGELAADEARELAAEYVRRAGRRGSRDDLDTRIQAAVIEALGRYNVASHESVTELRMRLEALEQLIARAAGAEATEAGAEVGAQA
jgi:polyhydroxyalkanoate synthesis regulator phasin